MTYARIEISQDADNAADNADKEVTWFLKAHKHTNFCGKQIFNFLFSKFLSKFIFYKLFDFQPPPPENES